MIRLIFRCALASACLAMFTMFVKQRAEMTALIEERPLVGFLVFLLLFAFGSIASAVAIVALDECIIKRREKRAVREQEERKHEQIKCEVRTSAQIVQEGPRRLVIYSEIDKRRRRSKRVPIRHERTLFSDVPLD